MFRKELSRISKTLDCRFLENMHLGSFFKSNNALHERKYSPLVLNKENVWLIVSTVYSSSILSKIPRCCEIILQKYKHRQLTFFLQWKKLPSKYAIHNISNSIEQCKGKECISCLGDYSLRSLKTFQDIKQITFGSVTDWLIGWTIYELKGSQKYALSFVSNQFKLLRFLVKVYSRHQRLSIKDFVGKVNNNLEIGCTRFSSSKTYNHYSEFKNIGRYFSNLLDCSLGWTFGLPSITIG